MECPACTPQGLQALPLSSPADPDVTSGKTGIPLLPYSNLRSPPAHPYFLAPAAPAPTAPFLLSGCYSRCPLLGHSHPCEAGTPPVRGQPAPPRGPEPHHSSDDCLPHTHTAPFMPAEHHGQRLQWTGRGGGAAGASQLPSPARPSMGVSSRRSSNTLFPPSSPLSWLVARSGIPGHRLGAPVLLPAPPPPGPELAREDPKRDLGTISTRPHESRSQRESHAPGAFSGCGCCSRKSPGAGGWGGCCGGGSREACAGHG